MKTENKHIKSTVAARCPVCQGMRFEFVLVDQHGGWCTDCFATKDIDPETLEAASRYWRSISREVSTALSQGDQINRRLGAI
jgi:hypothetical protein